MLGLSLGDTCYYAANQPCPSGWYASGGNCCQADATRTGSDVLVSELDPTTYYKAYVEPTTTTAACPACPTCTWSRAHCQSVYPCPTCPTCPTCSPVEQACPVPKPFPWFACLMAGAGIVAGAAVGAWLGSR